MLHTTVAALYDRVCHTSRDGEPSGASRAAGAANASRCGGALAPAHHADDVIRGELVSDHALNTTTGTTAADWNHSGWPGVLQAHRAPLAAEDLLGGDRLAVPVEAPIEDHEALTRRQVHVTVGEADHAGPGHAADRDREVVAGVAARVRDRQPVARLVVRELDALAWHRLVELAELERVVGPGLLHAELDRRILPAHVACLIGDAVSVAGNAHAVRLPGVEQDVAHPQADARTDEADALAVGMMQPPDKRDRVPPARGDAVQ